MQQWPRYPLVRIWALVPQLALPLHGEARSLAWALPRLGKHACELAAMMGYWLLLTSGMAYLLPGCANFCFVPRLVRQQRLALRRESWGRGEPWHRRRCRQSHAIHMGRPIAASRHHRHGSGHVHLTSVLWRWLHLRGRGRLSWIATLSVLYISAKPQRLVRWHDQGTQGVALLVHSQAEDKV